jgi:hypothetical protein
MSPKKAVPACKANRTFLSAYGPDILCVTDTAQAANWHGPIFCDMVTHMKTTIEIAPALLLQAKQVAQRDGTTLRQLVEAGLRTVLRAHAPKPFVLRDARVGGKGLCEEFQDGSWARMRDAIYEGRGA